VTVLGLVGTRFSEVGALRRVPSGLTRFLRFELLNECSEMRGNGSRHRVVLVFEALEHATPQGLRFGNILAAPEVPHGASGMGHPEVARKTLSSIANGSPVP
jgi:hypothetical protein